MDKKPDWIAAMLKDEPMGLQLFDINGSVRKNYVANSIPKFILIDKKGKIINFDAPMPNNNIELEKLLDREIAK